MLQRSKSAQKSCHSFMELSGHAAMVWQCHAAHACFPPHPSCNSSYHLGFKYPVWCKAPRPDYPCQPASQQGSCKKGCWGSPITLSRWQPWNPCRRQRRCAQSPLLLLPLPLPLPQAAKGTAPGACPEAERHRKHFGRGRAAEKVVWMVM